MVNDISPQLIQINNILTIGILKSHKKINLILTIKKHRYLISQKEITYFNQ